MPYAVSAPRCFIDVYPYEGGKYTVSANQASFIGVSVTKTIANGGNGQFNLNLAPGGPFGLNARPTWSDIFTPYSLVVIGMQRANHIAIVMVGLVVSTSEQQQRSQSDVRRVVQIRGEDFTRIFSMFCYYDLTYLLGVGPGASGNVLGLPSFVGDALQGPPDIVGAAWYNKIMAGPNGIMAQTSFAYQSSRVSFYDLMSTWFEPYPYDVQIPTMAPFIADEGSWLNKFLTFFPPYFYEFFIQTAPIGYYPQASTATQPITMTGYPSVSPTLVARASPQPYLTASGSASSPTFEMDLTRWYALQEFTMDGNHGSVSQELTYTETEVRNFYIFAPTWMATYYGVSNGSISPFQLLFSQWTDLASVHRYGFRPNNVELRWFADVNGTYAQTLAASGMSPDAFAGLVNFLSLRPVAFHEPTPNMLHGIVEMELRPDILAGNRFTFVPYRDGVKWTFYIDAVSHTIGFSGRTSTVLSISRGLPYDDYYNTELLVALHTGNAQRINGSLAIGLPPGIGQPLQPVNASTLQNIMAGAARLFGSPSGNGS